MTNQIKEKLIKLSEEIADLISCSSDLTNLDEIRVSSLGKKGSVTAYLKNLKDYDEETKKEIGSLVNQVKSNINNLIETKKVSFRQDLLNNRINSEKIDVTLSSKERDLGTLHPLSRTIEELSAIFADMGFSIVEGPDIETDYYNFTALNIPKEHPARQEHDTFYLEPDKEGNRKVLRTHT
ncbi:phenylalanine--tRNA ligase subunit alpha, partial [Alphaproteobacteria bacterium]|nr:phenylalanine--tRNA ligase subunit alpha [Alphaproteobacteria bacterium]